MGIEFNDQQVYALYQIENWWDSRNKQIFEISGSAGTGKSIDSRSLIPTNLGKKKLDDLLVGDVIYDPLGNETKILGIYDQGKKQAYEVTFEDGRKVICCQDHLWSVYKKRSHLFTTMSLKEMLRVGIKNWNGEYNFKIPMNKAVQYKARKYDMEPYDYGFSHKRESALNEDYLMGSISQRWELVQGLFDKHGVIDQTGTRNNLTYQSFSKEFIDSVRDLLFSLGISNTLNKIVKCRPYAKTYYKIYVRVNNHIKYRFFLHNKEKRNFAARLVSYKRRDYKKLAIIDVKKLNEKVPMKCLYVDNPFHLFLCNDYIVTHNTTLIKYFIDRIGLKTSEVAFTSFMGKACAQMAMNGLPAQTIHSLIYEYEKVLDRDDQGRIQLNNNGYPKMKYEFHLRDTLHKPVELIVVDEASMVSKEIASDLMSFGIPIIALGDLNQLPPVFGNSFFLTNPDVILTKVMRQNEDNPIIYLAQCILNDIPLKYGKYGKSMVLHKSDLNEFAIKNSDIVVTLTNKVRQAINDIYRENILGITKLELPHLKEKIICKKNNWGRHIDKSVFLTNGLNGTIEHINMESFDGKSLEIDFKPDFLNKKFKNIKLDYKRINQPVTDSSRFDLGSKYDQFEYAYALTCHSCQGSAWNKVIYLDEQVFDKEKLKKARYTAITRAVNEIQIYR